MNRCFLEINLYGFSEKASVPRIFFQKKSGGGSGRKKAIRERMPPGAEKRVFFCVSTGKMCFLSYL